MSSHDRTNLQARKFRLLEVILAEPKLSAAAKNVATVLLIKFHNAETGRCFPSYESIAAALGRKRRATIDATQELTDSGWVTAEITNGRSNRFVFAFDRLNPEMVQSTAPPDEPTSAVHCTPEVQYTAPPSAVHCTPEVQYTAPEPSREPSRVPEKEEERKSPVFVSPVGQAPLGGACPEKEGEGFDEFWEAYPKRSNRPGTKAEYEKQIAAGAKHPSIMVGVWKLASSSIPDMYIKSPERWLREEGWLDDYQPRNAPDAPENPLGKGFLGLALNKHG